MPLKRQYLNVPNIAVPIKDDKSNNKDWFKYLADVGTGLTTIEDDLNTAVTDLTTYVDEANTAQDEATEPNLTTIGDCKFSFDPNDHGVWLKLDGRSLSRTTYATLYEWANTRSLIGSVFGVGDGSTTFTLPNPQGRSPIVAGSGTGLSTRNQGDTGGTETHTLSSTEVPATPVSTGVISLGIGTTGSTGAYLNANSPTGSFTNFNVSAQTVLGGGAAHNNMHPFFAFNMFIKYE